MEPGAESDSEEEAWAVNDDETSGSESDSDNEDVVTEEPVVQQEAGGVEIRVIRTKTAKTFKKGEKSMLV